MLHPVQCVLVSILGIHVRQVVMWGVGAVLGGSWMHGVQDKLKAVLAWRRRLLPPCSARYTPGPCALSLQAALSLASQGHVRPCSQPAKTKLYGAMVTMEEMTVQWLYKVGPSAVFERPEVQWCSMYVCAALRCSAHLIALKQRLASLQSSWQRSWPPH